MKASVIKIAAVCFSVLLTCWAIQPVGSQPISHQTVDAFSESAVREFRFHEGRLARAQEPAAETFATIR